MSVAFPSPDDTTVQFGHFSYRMDERYSVRDSRANHFQTWTLEESIERISEADVYVLTGFFNEELLERATKLKYIQGIRVGYGQFPLEKLKERGIMFANAPHVIGNEVAEHAISLMLGLSRLIHTGRDNQNNATWRGMVSDLSEREDELIGKTLLIVGMGAAGSRLARFAKAFDMKVLATKRDPSTAVGPADEVGTPDRLAEMVPEADFIALTCPLTPETTNIIDANVLKAMKPTSYLINVARGQCVDEPELLRTLESGGIAGAGLDQFVEDPLGPDSPVWKLRNVIITPHGSGESRHSEDRVLDILDENLSRLWNGQTDLVNRII